MTPCKKCQDKYDERNCTDCDRLETWMKETEIKHIIMGLIQRILLYEHIHEAQRCPFVRAAVLKIGLKQI